MVDTVIANLRDQRVSAIPLRSVSLPASQFTPPRVLIDTDILGNVTYYYRTSDDSVTNPLDFQKLDTASGVAFVTS